MHHHEKFLRNFSKKEYLATAGLPSLTPKLGAELELCIFPAEIKDTVKALPNGKSPSTDVYTKVYYVKFLPLLPSHL